MRKNDVFITTTHTLSLTAFRSSFDMFDSKQSFWVTLNQISLRINWCEVRTFGKIQRKSVQTWFISEQQHVMS